MNKLKILIMTKNYKNKLRIKEIAEDAKKQNELAYKRRIEAYKALKHLRKLEMELENNCKSIKNN